MSNVQLAIQNVPLVTMVMMEFISFSRSCVCIAYRGNNGFLK